MEIRRNNISPKLLWVAVVLLFFQNAYASTDIEDNPISLTVLASSSLTDVMGELTRAYSKNKGYSIGISFGAPADLLSLVEDGESADVFITDDAEGMLNLKQKGLVDVFTISNIAQNKLVLAASKEHYLSRFVRNNTELDKLFEDLSGKVLLVMGDPKEVPVGKRAKEAIEKLGYWDGIGKFIVRTDRDSSTKYLLTNGINAGVMYYTDAFSNPEINILAEFPTELHSPIIYQAAAVAGLNMPLAREFVEFLKSKEARLVLKRRGFVVE